MDQKPILCLDFDGVIHSYSSGWQGADVVSDPPVDGALDFILDAREHFTVAIYSSRSGKQSGVTAMQGWLMSHMLQHSKEAGGPRDFGTESIAEVIDSIYWATEKPPAMVTIDDRALTFTGVWPSMDALTSFKPWNKQPDVEVIARLEVHDGLQVLARIEAKEGDDGQYGPCVIVRCDPSVTVEVTQGPFPDDEDGWNAADDLLKKFDLAAFVVGARQAVSGF